MRWSSARLLVAVALSAALGSGCLSSGTGWGPDPFAGEDQSQVFVQVENLSDADMTVSALASRQRHSLGVVRSRSSARFAIPWRAPDLLRFQIEPMGGPPHTTDALSMEPGERVQLFLQLPASRSTVRR